MAPSPRQDFAYNAASDGRSTPPLPGGYRLGSMLPFTCCTISQPSALTFSRALSLEELAAEKKMTSPPVLPRLSGNEGFQGPAAMQVMVFSEHVFLTLIIPYLDLSR